MTFPIIKDAPLPPPNNHGRGTSYPFADMQVGDAFDTPRDMGVCKNGSDKRQNTVCSCARGWAKKYNTTAKFAVRVIDANTVRCWRVA